MKALVIGATGAVGRDLVSELLQHDCWEEIHIFVRRSCGLRDSRIKEHIIDFENPKAWEGLVKGDVLFSALGTSRKQAGSKDAQWRVDYDYQYEFARAARRNGVRELVLVSSLGADAKSSYFYMSMKGKLEKAMQQLEFPSLVIMQPPALIRKKTKNDGTATCGIASDVQPVWVVQKLESHEDRGGGSGDGARRGRTARRNPYHQRPGYKDIWEVIII